MGDSAAALVLGEDGRSQWKAMSPDWAKFVRFWADPNNDIGLQDVYPYVLDLKLPDKIQKHIKPLVGLSTGILVTQSYADLYRRIKDGFRLDCLEDGIRSHPLRNGLILTGQPGTGTLPTLLINNCSSLDR